MDPRATIIKEAAERTPLTAEGLPIGIYRADLINPSPQLEDKEVKTEGEGIEDGPKDPETPKAEENLDHAYLELQFHEGFPALPGGYPLWHKWDFEPDNAFNCFQIYLNQIESGPRALAFLIKNPEVRQFICNGESTSLPSEEVSLKVHQALTDWFYTFYWQARAKGHDLFREAAYRQIRVRRAMECENYHYEQCDFLLKKVMDYMKSADFWEELAPKEAINMFKTLILTQRISAGLPGVGPLTPALEFQQTQDFELIMRTVAQRNQAPKDLYTEDGQPINEEAREALQGLLGDPTQTRLMQEMIIRVHDNRREAQGLAPGSASGAPALTPRGGTVRPPGPKSAPGLPKELAGPSGRPLKSTDPEDAEVIE